MFFDKAFRNLRRRYRWLLPILAVLAVLLAAEAYRAYAFYTDVSASKEALLSIKDDLDVTKLQDSEADVMAKQELLRSAGERLKSAESFVRTDPVLFLLEPLPFLGDQAQGLKTLVIAAEESVQTGLRATDVALAFTRYERDPNRTSIEEALTFLTSQEAAMSEIEAGLRRLQASRAELPAGLKGPLGSATADLDGALEKLEGLVEGYSRANALLPDLLGYNGMRRYLVLPQNDTELLPSGGLISSYGIVTFDGGRLVGMELEYFGTLFNRWQDQTGEYIEPPGPLKNYLKRDYSWGLGEAGWYPHFPTTAELASSFVAKGGAPSTDGTIAIDLKFMKALLELLGPVVVPDYSVTVTPENIEELTLELTRDDTYVPGAPAVATGAPKKAFLSYLASSVLNRVFAAPKEQWVDLLRLLDRMGRERHLQLHFNDERLQSLSNEYGFDGSMIGDSKGDYLLIADSSVNSTKLNLILDTKARIDLQLMPDGQARTLLTYEIGNPFPDWQEGRDPQLVRSLMLDGVYGCYLRVYASEQARLLDVRLAGKSAGAEQVDVERGRKVFGRFFPVLPGASASVQFFYETPSIVEEGPDGLFRYRVYVQKEAGTEALPLEVHMVLPKGARLESARVDGEAVEGMSIVTDLRTDREIEIVYRMS